MVRKEGCNPSYKDKTLSQSYGEAYTNKFFTKLINFCEENHRILTTGQGGESLKNKVPPIIDEVIDAMDKNFPGQCKTDALNDLYAEILLYYSLKALHFANKTERDYDEVIDHLDKIEELNIEAYGCFTLCKFVCTEYLIATRLRI